MPKIYSTVRTVGTVLCCDDASIRFISSLGLWLHSKDTKLQTCEHEKLTILNSCHFSPPFFQHNLINLVKMVPVSTKVAILLVAMLSTGSHPASCLALSSSSYFHGSSLRLHPTPTAYHATRFLEMRKQKSSDRRTRRMQRGDTAYAEELLAKSTVGIVTSSPMAGKSWRHKQTHSMQAPGATGGRGRSRKRSALYHSLSLYHNKFLTLLTEEYKQEVRLIPYCERYWWKIRGKPMTVGCCESSEKDTQESLFFIFYVGRLCLYY